MSIYLYTAKYGTYTTIHIQTLIFSKHPIDPPDSRVTTIIQNCGFKMIHPKVWRFHGGFTINKSGKNHWDKPDFPSL